MSSLCRTITLPISAPLNLAPSSVRDLWIHDADLVAGTHGRGFWILDDIAPLRQVANAAGAADAFLFAPPPAYRERWNRNTDTPLPPDEPAGRNPPDGAILDYYLAAAPDGPVTLEVLDVRGRLVRRWASDDPVQRCPDIRLAQERLGWQPTVPVHEGLTRTVAYFRKLLAF